MKEHYKRTFHFLIIIVALLALVPVNITIGQDLNQDDILGKRTYSNVELYLRDIFPNLGYRSAQDIIKTGTYNGENIQVENTPVHAKFLLNFGSSSSSASLFNGPAGLAIQSNDRIVVVDQFNNRIQVFDPSGESLFNFGSLGSGDGELNLPCGITTDGNDNIIVLDSGNNRIQVFDPNGEFLFNFGSLGSGDGEIDSSCDVTTDRDNNIIVADAGNSRVQVFDPNGEFLFNFGSFGTGDGELVFPAGITTDSNGNIIIADSGNNRIQVFDPNGEFLFNFGSFGTGDGEFNFPANVTTDNTDRIFITDAGNNRIQVFDSLGQFRFNFGILGTDDGELNFPIGIVTDSNDNIIVGEASNNRIQVFDPAGNSMFKFGSLANPGDGEFDFPIDVTIAQNDNIIVVDSDNNRIQVFDPNGEFLFTFGSLGTREGELNLPFGVTTDDQGNIIVADANNNRIQVFDPNGEFLFNFGSFGTGDGEFNFPFGVTTDNQGHIIVGDARNNRVQVFDPSGQFQFSFGALGSGDGELDFPSGIATDSNNNIYITDTNNHRVAVFDQSGEFLFNFGSLGSNLGQFGTLNLIAIDRLDRIILPDPGLHRVQIFDSSGEFLLAYGSLGTRNGQFNIPVGSVADSNNRIIIADSGNDRIQVFSIEEAEPLPQKPTATEVLTWANSLPIPLGAEAFSVGIFDRLVEDSFENNIGFSNQWITDQIDFYDNQADDAYREYTTEIMEGSGDGGLGMRFWLTDEDNLAFWDNAVRRNAGERGYARIVALNAAFTPGSDAFRANYGGSRSYDPETNTILFNDQEFPGVSSEEAIFELDIPSDPSEEELAELFKQTIRLGEPVRQQIFRLYEAFLQGEVTQEQISLFNETYVLTGGCAIAATDVQTEALVHRYLQSLNLMSQTLLEIGLGQSIPVSPPEGFSLSSVSVLPQNAGVSNILPEVTVFDFDPEEGYSLPERLEPFNGHWFSTEGGISLSVAGLPVEEYAREVTPGFHLFSGLVSGEASLTPYPDPGSIKAIFRFDPEIGYELTSTIPAGEAVWVNVDTMSSITVLPAQVNTNSIVSNNPYKETPWQTTLTSTGETVGTAVSVSSVVIEGSEFGTSTVPAPPTPPSYTTNLRLWELNFTSGPFFQDTRLQNTLPESMWVLEVDPHGSEPPPVDRTATVSWDGSTLGMGNWEIREGSDGTGAVIVADMISTTSFDVTGNSSQFFTIVYSPVDTTPVENPDELPDRFALEQNYPNPFNPTTKIQYQLPVASDVSIKIYDLTGKLIRTLVTDTLPAGYHSAEWDAKSNSGVEVASGVYIYQILASDFRGSNKMVLIR